MSPVFADTFYYLALLNEDDTAHTRAAAFRPASTPMVTTPWVLTEVADAMSAPGCRPLFLELLRQLQSSREVEVVPASDELFASGVNLFGSRMDKDWSLTDCISFVVMRERALTDALTGDHHFEQAGFKSLLK